MAMDKQAAKKSKVYFLLLHLGQGGIEQFAANLANEMAKKTDVEIISVYKKFDEPVPKFDAKIKVRYIFGFDIAARRKQLKYFGWLPWHYAMRSRMIGKEIRKIKRGAIITTRPEHNRILGRRANFGVKKIATEHNYLLGDERYTRAVVKSCRNLDFVVFPSREVFAYYQKKVVGATCLRIPHFLADKPRRQAKLEGQNVVSLGRLSYEKGYLDLIKVFYKVVKKCRGAKLDILGEGSERMRLQELVDELDLGEAVRMPGYVDVEGIDEALYNASIFVSASHTEAFGLGALEAMAYGVPVVTFSSARGILDFVENGQDGVVVKGRNKAEMAENIVKLLEDKKLRQELGGKARKKAESYSPAKIMPLWWGLLDK